MLKFQAAGPEQEAPLVAGDRFPCLVGGERSGKSTVSEKILIPHVLALPYLRYDTFYTKDGKLRFDYRDRNQKPRDPNFVIFGPTYKEPRVEFQMLERDLDKLGKLAQAHTSKPSDGAYRLVTTDGVVVQTMSLENPESVRSIDLEGAIVAESGGCEMAGIERVRGRVAAKRGFIVYNGTIEASHKWWQDWLIEGRRANNKGIVSYTIPTWSNRHEFPGGREDPEIVSWWHQLGDDLALERLAAVARPPRHRVVKEATEKHIRRMEIPEDAKVMLGIDPGYATAYAILFVAFWKDKNGNPLAYVADELYEQGKNTQDIIGLCKQHPLWGRVNEAVIDIASKGHRDATESSLEIWQKLTSLIMKHKYWPEDRSIERLQNSFHNDQVFVDPKCTGFIAELGLGEPVFPEMHEWKFAADKDGRIISEKPKDAWNHSCKAVAYLLLHEWGQVDLRRKPTTWNRLRRTGK